MQSDSDEDFQSADEGEDNVEAVSVKAAEPLLRSSKPSASDSSSPAACGDTTPSGAGRLSSADNTAGTPTVCRAAECVAEDTSKPEKIIPAESVQDNTKHEDPSSHGKTSPSKSKSDKPSPAKTGQAKSQSDKKASSSKRKNKSGKSKQSAQSKKPPNEPRAVECSTKATSELTKEGTEAKLSDESAEHSVGAIAEVKEEISVDQSSDSTVELGQSGDSTVELGQSGESTVELGQSGENTVELGQSIESTEELDQSVALAASITEDDQRWSASSKPSGLVSKIHQSDTTVTDIDQLESSGDTKPASDDNEAVAATSDKDDASQKSGDVTKTEVEGDTEVEVKEAVSTQEQEVTEEVTKVKSGEKDLSSVFSRMTEGADSTTGTARDSREENVLERLAQAGEKQQSAGWGSWGSWGSSILNTATSSIQTFTGQVSEGMHTVVETFEASVGAPPPHELASDISQFVKEPDEREKVISRGSSEDGESDTKVDDGAPVSAEEAVSADGVVSADGAAAAQDCDSGEKALDDSDWFAGWGVSGITHQLQSKTKVLVESGLDVLETIGKKTMEQIQDTDPGFAKTKGLLRGNVANLSQTLREAKEENERKAAEESNAQPLTNYSALFDQHQGLACLEALELLSISCTESLSSLEDMAEETQLKMDALTEKFTLVYDSDDDCDEEHDFSAGIEDFVSKISLPVRHDRLLSVQSKATEWLTNCEERQETGEQIEGREIHNEALNSFAELTSATMELCNKSGTLLLLSLQQETIIDVETVSDSFLSILRLVASELSIQSQRFNGCLNTAADDSEDPDSINPMITDVFLEASNSTSYVRDAVKLLVPVLQKCLLTPSGGLS